MKWKDLRGATLTLSITHVFDLRVAIKKGSLLFFLHFLLRRTKNGFLD
jgi:hypothetical protein